MKVELNENKFEKDWENYWYKHKPLGRRLRDDMSEELKICSEFYASLMKIYP